MNGDSRAFEALYRCHVGRVYGLALRLTLDPGLAEDLTQETFVQVWQRLASFRFESRFGTWLYRVASNVVLAALRRRNPLERVSDAVSEAVQPTVSGGELGVEIESGLRRLPERARVVLILHDLAGMTHEEIGEELDIAPGTSKAQLFRARRLYRGLEDSDG